MMSEREIRREFDRHAYKPGYQISVDFGGVTFSGSPIMAISVRTQNSYRPDKTVDLRFARPLPRMDHLDVDMLRHFIHKTIVDFEWHEASEWHRVDGELHLDPHNTNGR